MSCEVVMNNHSTLRGLRILAFTVIAGAAIGASAPSTAATHFAGGGARGVSGFHGGYAVRPGFRAGYGYGGYRGYGYGYGYRGGWGWPGGLFLATLPLYYSTWYWNGVPYYYAYDNYYVWNGPAAQYEQVAPPEGLISGGAPEQGSGDLFAYPKNGQSAEQQARDKQQCRDWALAQSGNAQAAPGGAAGAIASASPASPQSGAVNLRAQAACLEGRGYSVK
jgi:hypothetical protein